jgi:hypothetical protein
VHGHRRAVGFAQESSLADVLHQVGRDRLFTYLGTESPTTLEPSEPYAAISSGPPELVMEIAEAGGSLSPGLYLLPNISPESLVALTSPQESVVSSPAKAPPAPRVRLMSSVRRRRA